MGKVLVVGGAGYLGRHVADILGKRAVVFDNLLYASDYWEPHEFIYGDVTNTIRLSLALKKHDYDAVVWLAAIVGDAACALDPARAIAVNYDAVGWVARNYGGRIIFTSSCSLYGASDEIATESSLLDPLSIYAETKMKAEEALLRRGSSLILRLGTLHGPSSRMRFDLMVNAMTLSAFTQDVVTVFGGSQYRPLLHIQDAAAFIVKMVDREWQPDIYNLATENTSVVLVAEAVSRIVHPSKISFRSLEFEDRRNYQVDSSRAFNKLGFSWHYPYLSSIKTIYKLLKSGRIKNPSDPRYYNIRALGGCNGT